MRSFVVFTLSLLALSSSAFNTDTFIANLEERQLAVVEEADLSLADQECMMNSLESATNSVAAALQFFTSSDLGDICPAEGVCTLDLQGTDLVSNVKAACTDGKFFSESISFCQDTILSIKEMIPALAQAIIDLELFDSGDSEDTADFINVMSELLIQELDSLNEVVIIGIPVCLSSSCPDDFDIFGVLGKLLPELMDMVPDNEIPDELVPIMDDLFDIISKVMAGDDCDSIVSCIDSPLRFKRKGRSMACKWAAYNPTKRCAKRGIASHCPKSCNTCNTFDAMDSVLCADSNKKWYKKSNKRDKVKAKGCAWVKRGNTEKKCEIEGVKETCRETCNFCDR